MEKRSLYECFNAKVLGDRIYCAKGHIFSKSGEVNINRLARGTPLEMSVCQGCPDFDEMGPPVLPEDRGWFNKPLWLEGNKIGGQK